MEWIKQALRAHPEVALFLTLAAGHWVGQLRIKKFKLGAVVGCLLVGVAVAQLGATVPPVIGRMFFLLFLFSVGYKTGPQFFRSLGKNAIVPVILTLSFCIVGLFTAYAIARMLGFDAGMAAGMLSGGLNSSEAMGTATDALGRLQLSEDLRRTLASDITVGYAVTYPVAIFMGIFLLTKVGPWLMRIDLRTECRKLEEELGMKREEPGLVSAYRPFVMRAYRIPESLAYTVASELENIFSPERVFVERAKTDNGIFDGSADLQLLAGNLVVLSGRPGVLAGPTNPLRTYEVEDRELLDIPAIQFDYIMERKDLLYKTLAEVVAALGGEAATRGVYVRKVLRAGEELPLGSKVRLEPGDVLTLVGAKRHLEQLATQLGSVQRPSDATDLVSLTLAIVLGAAIGLPAVHIAGLRIAFGIPVGVLLFSLLLGWLRAVRPRFGKVPEPALELLDSLGLTVFVATIGINAGPSFVHGVRTAGLLLFACGVVVSSAPYLATMLAGRYIFKVHPCILLGICAGSATFSPGLAALKEKGDSRVPALGFGMSYAIGAIVYAFMGSLIVALVHTP